jgi:hypothetical protein
LGDRCDAIGLRQDRAQRILILGNISHLEQSSKPYLQVCVHQKLIVYDSRQRGWAILGYLQSVASNARACML